MSWVGFWHLVQDTHSGDKLLKIRVSFLEPALQTFTTERRTSLMGVTRAPWALPYDHNHECDPSGLGKGLACISPIPSPHPSPQNSHREAQLCIPSPEPCPKGPGSRNLRKPLSG